MKEIPLGNRLANYGWKKEDDVFLFFLAKVWYTKNYAKRFPNVEQMLFQPSVGSILYVKDVREITGLKDIPEEDVLQPLSNIRKNGFLEATGYNEGWVG